MAKLIWPDRVTALLGQAVGIGLVIDANLQIVEKPLLGKGDLWLEILYGRSPDKTIV
ncbi:MAG: hypothetical protein MJE77_01130 [Proteobacteria bacterium]|nr:hypothetical protein [Pseudomonadota bacterium]